MHGPCWWSASITINRALCGDRTEPLCSRVHRQQPARWRSLYMFTVDLIFGEFDHCAKINARWQSLNNGDPR